MFILSLFEDISSRERFDALISCAVAENCCQSFDMIFRFILFRL